MVLYIMRWDIVPDKMEAYLKWSEGAIRRTVAAPGVIEFRAYRTAASPPGQVVVTYEFKDMVAWAEWYSQEDVRKVRDELSTLTTNWTAELWGPSPVVPEPIRPGK